MKKKSSGFTIVELLVVIVVIGILAAITIVSYSGISQRAKETSIQSDLKNASTQLEIDRTENDTYPNSKASANNNQGLKSSPGNTLAYIRSSETSYCLQGSNSNLTYYINSTNKTITQGPCPADPNWLIVGTQVWAKKNLNVGTRINGTAEQTNNGGTNIVEKYCYDDDESNCTTYGALYQWNEAMQYVTTPGAQGICPAGSHIPSDNDWKILEMQLGMTQAQADAYGYRGTDQGNQLEPSGSSGLNLPLAGYRDIGGSFNALSSSALLWSSSESGGNAWIRGLDSSLATVYRDTVDKVNGWSVRCLGN